MDKAMNREDWLNQAVEKLQPIFTEQGYQVPKVKVSCGFPSTGSTKHIGQCWVRYASEQDINEIFISPVLDDSVAVLDTLMHELVHAVDNCQHGHGAEFKKIALSVGLQGKMRQAAAGEKLKDRLAKIATTMQSYPHKKIKHSKPQKIYKPTPKAKCADCGYQTRVLKKWLHYGPPICPVHKTVMTPLGNWDEE